MYYRIMNAGFGGQGVMLLGRLMAYTGMKNGKRVLWMPSYGSEMRGGTANCSVIIADSEIETPVFKEADAIIIMNKPSLLKFESRVAGGGNLLVNSTLVDREIEREDINVHHIPAGRIAEELGNPKIANMVMMGAFIEITGIFKLQEVSQILPEVLPEKYHQMLAVNEGALKKGREYIRV